MFEWVGFKAAPLQLWARRTWHAADVRIVHLCAHTSLVMKCFFDEARDPICVCNLASWLVVHLLSGGITHTAAAVVAPASSFNIAHVDEPSCVNVQISKLSVSLYPQTYFLPRFNLLPRSFPIKPCLYCFYCLHIPRGSLRNNLKFFFPILTIIHLVLNLFYVVISWIKLPLCFHH